MTHAGAGPDWLVLYGSLRRELPDFRRLGLGHALTWLGPCVVRGTLHDLGAYPGLSPAGGTDIQADLFAISDAAVLGQLDAFEGYVPEDTAASLYLRRRIAVRRPAVEAWIYLYNGELDGAPVVVSGDWLALLAAR
ncbi:MAG TPA: gamma-glutamylcyclotransferase family protein [Afifellaceae bacterium]|nr:gamma-glutamylcyclotransferase family protein [Afifellaceae bacterium]